VSTYENDTVRLEDVTLRTNDDGLLEAVIDDAVTITEISTHATPDDDAGGDESGTQSTAETVTTDSPDSQSQTVTSNQTATDGGESDTDNHQQTDTTEPTDVREQLATAFAAAVEDSTGLADKMALQRTLTEYCDDMQAAKEMIDRATTEGWLSEPVSHRYRRESLPEVSR